MFPNGLASQEGTIQKGDEVLSINGKSLKGATHNDALAILRQARDPRQAVIVTRRPALEATPDPSSSTDSAASASEAGDVSVDSGKCPPPPSLGGGRPLAMWGQSRCGCSVTRGPENSRAAWHAAGGVCVRPCPGEGGRRASRGSRDARASRPGEEGVPDPVPVLPPQRRPQCTR